MYRPFHRRRHVGAGVKTGKSPVDARNALALNLALSRLLGICLVDNLSGFKSTTVTVLGELGTLATSKDYTVSRERLGFDIYCRRNEGQSEWVYRFLSIFLSLCCVCFGYRLSLLSARVSPAHSDGDCSGFRRGEWRMWIALLGSRSASHRENSSVDCRRTGCRIDSTWTQFGRRVTNGTAGDEPPQ